MADFDQNGYHIDQPVRVLLTDYSPWINVGDVKTIKKFGPKGVFLDSDCGPLYFRWHEIKPAGTVHTPAVATIDHGRLETLKRREAFSKVHIEVLDKYGSKPQFSIATDDMLSPRRIARSIVTGLDTTMHWGNGKRRARRNRGEKAIQFADAAYELLCAYREYGYILPDILEVRVKSWRVRLVSN